VDAINDFQTSYSGQDVDVCLLPKLFGLISNICPLMLQEVERHKTVVMSFDAKITNREQVLLQEKVSAFLLGPRLMTQAGS
jgi:hypothetical protein